MTERKRILWLILVMMAAVSVSTAVAISLLYRVAFEQTRAQLLYSAHEQVQAIEAAVDCRRAADAATDPAHLLQAVLPRILRPFLHPLDDDQPVEIAVAHRDGDEIAYLVTHGSPAAAPSPSIPFDSLLGEPMRRALSGETGTLVGPDYRGVRVLAAYQPVSALGLGVVTKVDLAALRAPFVRATLTAIGLALLLVISGSLLFLRLTRPMVQRLADTEQRYQRIFEGVPVPIWEQDLSAVADALADLRTAGVRDLQGHLADRPELLGQLVGRIRVKDANQAALTLFGAGSEGRFRQWFVGHLLPASREHSARMLQAIWEGQPALLNQRVRVQTPDGRELMLVLSSVIPSAADGYRSVPAAALDVTAELQLGRREEELGLILASTGEGIFGIDLAGACTFVNRAALRMLGYGDERQMLGRDMHALIHHSCRDGTPLPAAGCPILRASRQDVVTCLDDETFWRADGTSLPVGYCSYPMWREGELVGRVVTFVDVTERKAREAELVQAQKMEVIGQLSGAIAHDFGNLLAIILTNLHVLQSQLREAADPELAELLADTLSAAEDGAGLTRRLLAFARRQPLEPQWLDLDAFIEHTGRFLRRIAGKDVRLVVQGGGGPLPVRVDRQQLEVAILNLAINARDAMPDGGTLRIEVGRRVIAEAKPSELGGLSPGTYAVVDIIDTGVGMSPETLKRAVEPFYSSKPLGKGSGLGLSSALGFAQQSGGGLVIRSAPGQGTTASLYLPEAEPVPNEAERASRPSETPATILVVDDDARVRRFTRQALTELGHRVVEAEHAAGAIEILEAQAGIDLLLTDVVMPGELDGRGLARWARQHRPGLRVLLVSGFPPEVARGQGEGAEPFLAKPYSKEQLAAAIRPLLNPRLH